MREGAASTQQATEHILDANTELEHRAHLRRRAQRAGDLDRSAGLAGLAQSDAVSAALVRERCRAAPSAALSAQLAALLRACCLSCALAMRVREMSFTSSSAS
jgi:hypothetical protein